MTRILLCSYLNFNVWAGRVLKAHGCEMKTTRRRTEYVWAMETLLIIPRISNSYRTYSDAERREPSNKRIKMFAANECFPRIQKWNYSQHYILNATGTRIAYYNMYPTTEGSWIRKTTCSVVKRVQKRTRYEWIFVWKLSDTNNWKHW